MKTTLELPDALFKEVKVRAIHDGKKLKDEIADLLRKGLVADAPPSSARPEFKIDRRTRLPVIMGGRSPAKGEGLTPKMAAEILAEQEIEAHVKAHR
jgi:hypothetical protein